MDIEPEQVREDLSRLSAVAMAVVAQSARLADGEHDPVGDDVVARGTTAAEKFLLRWRGEADERHAKAVDTYWICTAEHGLNASTFTARVVASTGADCGAALSAAVGALSGPLHGGAPARVLPMLDAVAESGDAQAYVQGMLERKERIMGFGHRVYRAEDPRARLLRQTARELGSPRVEVAEELERVALDELAEALSRPCAGDQRRVLVGRRARHRGDPARPDPGDVRLRAGRRLVGAHPRGEAHRPPDPAVGRVRGPRQPACSAVNGTRAVH